jgi:beta-lactamase regulating signal transducer with metallopeptidase domain
MIGFLHVAEPLARSLAAIVLNALWEDAVIFIAVGLLVRFWRNLSAATRYAAWYIALIAAVAVPVLTTHSDAGAPPPSRAALADRALARRAISPPMARPGRASAPITAQGSFEQAASSPASRGLAPPRVEVPGVVALAAAALWGAAALFFLMRLLVALARLERLKRNALPLPMEYRDALARWNAAGSRAIRLCVSDEIEVPVAVGLFDAMILMPRVLLESMSPQEVTQVYLHERAHLRRGDDWTNLAQRIATAIAWFSPGIYAIARALDLEREVACDDDVVARTGEVRPYAQCLTHIVEITAWPHHALATPGAFVTRRGISERIERLLSAGRGGARGLSLAPAVLAFAVVGTLALAMPALAVTLAPPQASPPHVPPELVTAAAPTASPAPSAPAVLHIAVAAQHVRVPARHIDVPARHIDVPAVHVNVPRIFDVPGMNFTIPAIDVNVPAIHMDVPNYRGRIEREFHSRSCRSACDLSGVNWAGANLSGRSYSATDFSHADLRGTNFARDHLQVVDFGNADLRDADFNGADMTYVDFTGARLAGATFDGAAISVCDFGGADVSRADLSRAHLDTICRESMAHR